MIPSSIFAVLLAIILPYFLGYFLSDFNFSNGKTNISESDLNSALNQFQDMEEKSSSTTTNNNTKTKSSYYQYLKQTLDLDEASFDIHRNGESAACGGVTLEYLPSELSTAATLQQSSSSTKYNRNSKYYVDVLLTLMFERKLNQCGIAPNPDPYGFYSSKWDKWYKDMSSRPIPPFLQFCDMGPERTTIQTDHNQLLKLSTTNTYPCHFHTREGVRVTSIKQLSQLLKNKNDNKLDLYAVPAGRVFMFAPTFVGERFELTHVDNPDNEPVWLEVLSISPKVFEVHNFFTPSEATDLVEVALAETRDEYKLKRSSTGAAGYNVNPTRTSENAFDTSSPTAVAVKKRCIKTLGYDHYEEGITDGLQILRYNQTKAYIAHMDWIDDYGRQQEHDFFSHELGSNRISTILLYFTDLPENAGGQTVFVKGTPYPFSDSGNGQQRLVNEDEAIEKVRSAGLVDLFDRGSWEERLVGQCNTRLTTKPRKAKAVLFYSQHPDGQADKMSEHGGCPVLAGTKWAANLWVWNAPRSGFDGAPINPSMREKVESTQRIAHNDELQAVFFNDGEIYDTAELYFEDNFWSKFDKGDTSSVNTFPGHVWNVRVNNQVVHTWTVSQDQKFQEFRI